MGVNSLAKTVTRQRRGCDLNPGRSAPESSTLATRLAGALDVMVSDKECGAYSLEYASVVDRLTGHVTSSSTERVNKPEPRGYRCQEETPVDLPTGASQLRGGGWVTAVCHA